MQSASRVGALAVIFVLLVVGVFAWLNKGFFATITHHYWAEFDDAGGLSRGSQVLVAGVAVGQVDDVQLSPQGKAIISMAMRPEVKVTQGSVALVPGSFIALGDKVVVLQIAKNGQPLAPDNRDHPLPGKVQGPLDSVVPDSGATVKELNKTLEAVQSLLTDPKLKENITALTGNVATTADKFGGTASRVNGLIDTNQAKLGHIVASVDRSLTNLEAVSVKIKQISTDDKMQGNVEKLMKDLDAAVVSGQKMVDDLHAYTGDAKMHDSISGTVTNVKEMTDSGTKIAKDFEKISANGVEISGGAKDATQKVNQLLDKANNLADKVGKVVDDAKGTIDKFNKGDKKASLFPPISLETDLTHESGPDQLRADFSFGLPIGKEKLQFGLYDAFESNKLTAQISHPFGNGLDIRYGMYASKAGLGVDYATDSKVGLRTDLYGFNDARFDVKARFDFGGGVNLLLGFDRVFTHNTPSIGIGIRRN